MRGRSAPLDASSSTCAPRRTGRSESSTSRPVRCTSRSPAAASASSPRERPRCPARCGCPRESRACRPRLLSPSGPTAPMLCAGPCTWPATPSASDDSWMFACPASISAESLVGRRARRSRRRGPPGPAARRSPPSKVPSGAHLDALTASSLVGNGGGLTPLGDDVLCGWLAVLVATDRLDDEVTDAVRQVARPHDAAVGDPARLRAARRGAAGVRGLRRRARHRRRGHRSPAP